MIRINKPTDSGIQVLALDEKHIVSYKFFKDLQGVVVTVEFSMVNGNVVSTRLDKIVNGPQILKTLGITSEKKAKTIIKKKA